jgi:hypothetical protein
MHRRILIAVVCLAVASAALLGVGVLWAQADEKSAAEVPAKIPDEEKRRKNPQEATPQSIANGKQIFSSQCAMCHGATGDGKGDLAARIGYKMADFTDPKARRRVLLHPDARPREDERGGRTTQRGNSLESGQLHPHPCPAGGLLITG